MKALKYLYSNTHKRNARKAYQDYINSFDGGLFGVMVNNILLNIRFKSNLEAVQHAKNNGGVAVYVPSAIKYIEALNK